MKIGVVLPVHNLWKAYTKPCLDSLKSKHELRIVLVDNGSSDETSQEAQKLVGNNFIHRRNLVNLGCSPAWNWGVRDSFEKGCDYVIVLNNDTLLHPEAIDRLVDRFEKEKELGKTDIVMITCLDATGECVIPTLVFGLNASEKEGVPESEHPCFSAFMINRKCWEEVGEFDEGFFPAYYEDNDYHYRIKLAGLKAVTLPSAIFYHYGSRTQNESESKPIANSGDTGKYFFRKWGDMPGRELYKNPFNVEQRSLRWTQQTPDL